MYSFLLIFLSLALSSDAITPEIIEQAKKDFWAYKAPQNHKIPENEGSWGNNAVDAFIFEALRENKLTPSEQADKRTLIRRVYFDLTGLPPAFEELESFVNDKSPGAYEKLIDKLLASPAYGERWGRHWLDVARYADTQGYNFTSSSRYPFAYTYRDYVIRSFNEDKPYDIFIKEQLAADLMNYKGEALKNLAALGFLTVGERFLNKNDEIINDRIDLTTQAFLAMTVACSRCHDHKVDPIPAADYYSLYGIFKSCHEPKVEDLPLIGEAKDKKAHEKYLKDRENTLKELADKEMAIFEKARKEWPEFADGLIDYIGQNRIHRKNEKRDHRGRALRNGHVELLKSYISGEEGKADGFYALLHHIYHRGNDKDVKNLVNDYKNRPQTPAKLKELLSRQDLSKRQQVYEVYRDLVNNAFSKGKNDESYAEIREFVYGRKFHEIYNKLPKRKVVERDERNELTKIENKLKDLMISKGAPPRAMVLYDQEKMYKPYIFIRGKAHDKGPEVKRRFPQIISYKEEHKEFTRGSGRLELAEAIADPKNPLTARVMVNRIWQWHFGEGIVSTPSNFGQMGLPPSNLKLLDHLALKFIKDGWSVKKLHKYIMTSAVYMQKSLIREDMAAIDGANKYLWRMNMRRIEWEALRDSMMQVSGTLSDRQGGPAENIMDFKAVNSRSVYGFLDREKIPGALKSFDFPSPQVSCEARVKTVVPQQGLFLMNSKLVTDCARSISSKLDAGKTAEEKIKNLFKRTLSRLPLEGELSKAVAFINNNKDNFNYKEPEFEFGIAKIENGRLLEFKSFDLFKDDTWQFKGGFPHKIYGYSSLKANGGHPGRNLAVTRQVKIFENGTLSLEGQLKHPNSQGDGVRAVLLLNGLKIQHWDSHNRTVQTKFEGVQVKSGDLISLAVEPLKSDSFDSYTWSKKLKFNSSAKTKVLDLQAVFSGRQSIEGQVFSVWDALAQVMLMSNEFQYVD